MKFRMHIILFFACNAIIAQQGYDAQESELVQIVTSANEKYGIDQQLANGVYFDDLFRNAEGHPYILNDEFVNGSVIYKGSYYPDVQLKYDIYEQKILILHQQGNTDFVTILTWEFLSAFSIYDRNFKKLSLNGAQPAFYQVIEGDGELQCYYHWTKNREEKTDDNLTMINSFTSEKRIMYLSLSGKVYKYRGNHSFVHLFSREYRKNIKQYMRGRRLRIRRASDEEMSELLRQCESIINWKEIVT